MVNPFRAKQVIESTSLNAKGLNDEIDSLIPYDGPI